MDLNCCNPRIREAFDQLGIGARCDCVLVGTSSRYTADTYGSGNGIGGRYDRYGRYVARQVREVDRHQLQAHRFLRAAQHSQSTSGSARDRSYPLPFASVAVRVAQRSAARARADQPATVRIRGGLHPWPFLSMAAAQRSQKTSGSDAAAPRVPMGPISMVPMVPTDGDSQICFHRGGGTGGSNGTSGTEWYRVVPSGTEGHVPTAPTATPRSP